jgi:hypothetical protein
MDTESFWTVAISGNVTAATDRAALRAFGDKVKASDRGLKVSTRRRARTAKAGQLEPQTTYPLSALLELDEGVAAMRDLAERLLIELRPHLTNHERLALMNALTDPDAR